ncbi:MAG TPA: response regulator [Candidatus Solibacter sp.]|nr:response regulator [Candidatus Solibacter sp.]
MRVLIADDEAPARARLRQMLSAHADIEIAGEAETGPQTIELATELHPDLILLDIQMPGATGIDVAACLPEPRPRIIFCTAYDQYAVDAFELQAADYLLKPVTRARLAQALDRVRTAAPSPGTPPGRFLVKSGTHFTVVAEPRVLYFASEDGLTKLVAAEAHYWMDPTLNDLEQRLDPARFFRVSRAALVAIAAIAEVHPMPGGSGEVRLKNGDRLEVSRRRFRALLETLGGNP